MSLKPCNHGLAGHLQIDTTRRERSNEIVLQKRSRFGACHQVCLEVGECQPAHRFGGVFCGAQLRKRPESSPDCRSIDLGIWKLAAEVAKSQGFVHLLRVVRPVEMSGLLEDDQPFRLRQIGKQLSNVLQNHECVGLTRQQQR